MVAFEASPEVLSHLLDLGIAPGDGLLKLCACSCTHLIIASVRLLLNKRKVLCMSCTERDMSVLFEGVVDHYHKHLRNLGDPCKENHFSMLQ